MKIDWKDGFGPALALAVACGMFAADGASARKTSSTNSPSAEKTGRPKEKDKMATARPIKKGPGECISYTINKYGNKVCSKTKDNKKD